MSRTKVIVTVVVVLALCTSLGVLVYHWRAIGVRRNVNIGPLNEADGRASESHAASASKLAIASPEVGVHFEPPVAALGRHKKPLDPAYVAMVKHDAAVAQMKSNFADFLVGARLTAAEAAQLLDLLAEEREAALELILAARARGSYWGDSPDLEAAVLAAATSRDSEIARLLGAEGYAQFEDFRDTTMIRMTLEDFNDRLIDQGDPLTDVQTRKLIQTLNAMDTPASKRRAPIKAVVQVIGMRVTDEMVDAASSILSASQLSALRSLQIAQQQPERSTIGSSKTTSVGVH